LHGGISIQYAPKIVWHPNPGVPLAFAVGGCTSIRLKGKPRPVTEHLLEFANEIVSPSELELAAIARRLEEQVLPGIEEAKLAAQIFIALVRNGKAAVGIQCFDVELGQIRTTFHEKCLRILPPRIEPAYQKQDWDLLHDRAISHPDAVVQQARLFADKGIAFDAKLNSGQHKWCGGGVEVVLVISAGAKLV
jgi:hypothetical protein